MQKILRVATFVVLLLRSDGAGGFFWGNSDKNTIGSTSSSSDKVHANSKPSSTYSARDDAVDRRSTMSLGPKLMPSITDVDDSHLYISEVSDVLTNLRNYDLLNRRY